MAVLDRNSMRARLFGSPAVSKRMFRKTLLLLFPVMLYAAQSPPHVIIIYVDDLGWNDVSFHGSPDIPTPNMDAVGLSGLTLNNYYGQHMCTPSRGALFTGKYPVRLGLQHYALQACERSGLPLSETTLPQHLKNLGYSTHMLGKWHLGYMSKEYTPTYRGFDTFFGFYNGYVDYYDYTHELQTLLPELTKMHGIDLHESSGPIIRDVTGCRPTEYATDLLADKAAEIISAHNATQPLFLYFAPNAVHAQALEKNIMQAPPDAIAKFKHIKDIGRRTHAGGNTADLGPIDGYDMWDAFTNDSPSPRSELLYNIDPLEATSAYRSGDLKVISGTSASSYNYWHGTSGDLPKPESMYQWVFQHGSTVKEILQEEGYWIAQDPDKWYSQNTVDCRQQLDSKPSDPDSKPCLFNVTADPCEYNDLANELPEEVDSLMGRIQDYAERAAVPQAKEIDPTGNPMCFNYTYVTWLDPVYQQYVEKCTF